MTYGNYKDYDYKAIEPFEFSPDHLVPIEPEPPHPIAFPQQSDRSAIREPLDFLHEHLIAP